MNKNCLSFIFLMVSSWVFGQNIEIQLEEKSISGRQLNEQSWIFEDEEDTIIAVSKDVYDELVKRIRILQQDTTRLTEILEAKNELIAEFDQYERAAEAHIGKQDSLIMTADTLYEGYKQLYKDLKSIADLNPFSIIPGIGFIWKPNRQVVGSFGVEYEKFQGHYQIGKGYQGIVVGYRIGF